ncbi:hypothetical protein VHEMI06327 [[Torrubiella] hemipterigena]|uniref:CN hydrolase domain-containing protein n=1 Tax=[Torrubiella] hemipterigena TaxID=1531966 RepID=A0A0A1T099_9HYPO|nr:hypothetical protein VHEMI06327 [[Torrubiella] hemipterigena]
MSRTTQSPAGNTIKLAAVQASPVFLNKAATTEKVCELILEAGKQGADIVGFPETFVSGYPGWVELVALSTNLASSLFIRLFDEAVEVPGPETDAISTACKEAGIYAIVGINERRANTTGTLWNTNLFFGKDGSLLHKHQKFTPTVGERLIHAPGTTGSKTSILTDFGPVSSLICGENGNPLAIYSLSLDYPVVHVASWPPHMALGQMSGDVAKLFSGFVASSAGCYVINAVAVVDDKAIDEYGIDDEIKAYLKREQNHRQASIIAPGGKAVPTYSSHSNELIFADVDVANLKRFKYGLDFAGHYNRPEVFAHHFEQYL